MYNITIVLLLVLVLTSYSLVVSGSSGVQCLDENGDKVDWWVIQKQPTLSGTTGRFLEGLAYSYADEYSETLELSTKWLNASNTALAYTLAQIYSDSKSDDMLWIMYNDQLPEEGSSASSDSEESSDGQGPISSTFAHSKGTLAFKKSNGFWLIHSTPRFPWDPHQSAYIFPENEVNNGQSFLCVSYDTQDNFDKISTKLFINRPYIYAYNIPDTSIGVSTSVINSLINGDYESSPATDTNALYSLKGVEFQVFAKNKQWNQDLYEMLIQPTLNQNMLVTSWRLGANSTIMPTFCTPTYDYDSVNTMNFVFSGDGSDQYTWRYTKDHSKWAISFKDAETSYVCIGDINRMYSQYKRGGGSACFSNSILWTSYYNTISNAAYCSSSEYKNTVKIINN
ncbi:deoxyribonuclease II [Tieghemostelium lacteum]|uniref:Deoxyribonuclease II n=1 Tax=Tieghemostelium lacteum TaxID=361077 RepID=A0A151ZGP6_TIELA|nr:deoxyribonuclease II [Tieghemostelium lacteum]|eukprot:KYQ93158.1 deoxyribonuclease II [Tieghemostelium lacteum]